MRKISESDILKANSYLYPKKIPKKVINIWVAEIKQKQAENNAKMDYELLNVPMDL